MGTLVVRFAQYVKMAGFADKIIQRKAEMQLYKNFRIKENPKPSNNHFDGLGLLRLR